MKKSLKAIMCLCALSAVLATGCSKADNTVVTEAETTVAETSAEETTEAESTEAEASETGTISITHELGTTEFPVNPTKIISFDLGIVDALNSVGIEVGGLPKKTLPEYLSKFSDDKYLNAGSMKEADFEAINSYEPDLIIISDRMKDSYSEFAEIAPTIYIPMPSVPYTETTKANIEQLMEMFPEKASQLEAKFAEVEAAVKALDEKVAPKELTALVLMANDGALSVYGPGSRYGIIHDEFGFVPADDTIDVSTHGQTVTFEYIQEKNPDYIFVIDRGAAIGKGEGAAALLDNELVNETTAAKDGHIVYLSSGIWYLANGGIDATLQMVKEVSDSVE